MAIVLIAFTFAGIGLLAGICISDIRASAAHQRWIEKNHKRRYGVK